MAAVAAGQHRMRLGELSRVGHRPGGLVVEAQLDGPFVDVPAAVATGRPGHPAGGQQHVPARYRQFLGDLRARLPAAHDQHGTGWQRRGAAVPGRVVLADVPRKLGRKPGDDGAALTAAGHHHGAGRDHARGDGHLVPVAAGRDRGDLSTLPHRQPPGEPFQQRDHGIPGQEVPPRARRHPVTGQPGHPVRGDERERIPPRRPPAFADTAPLQHDMLDPERLQVVADRQPCLARANYDHLDMFRCPVRSHGFSSRTGPRRCSAERRRKTPARWPGFCCKTANGGPSPPPGRDWSGPGHRPGGRGILQS